MGDSTKKRRKLPKDVKTLTGDEVMKKVFGKRVAKKLKEVAHEGEAKEPESE